ncbi:MAG: hypothetical protein R3F39_01600 [Myxococcota bacterium]
MNPATPDDAAAPATPDGETGWDPFAGHEAFASRGPGRESQALAESRVRMRLPEQMESRVRPLMDPDALEALIHWQGVVAHPTVRDKADYPNDLHEALENCEAQFILRNIPRYELWRDPNEPMAYTRSAVEYGLRVPGANEVRELRVEPVELLDVMSTDTLRDETRLRRVLRTGVEWARCFGKEASVDISGPQWRNVPRDVRVLLGELSAEPGEAA